MKKVISLIIIVSTLILTLCSCNFTSNKKIALVVSGTEVSEEVYNYYYDLVKQRPTDYGIESSRKTSQIKDAAIKLCVRYVAINTSFAKRELTLTNVDKIQIADNVNNYWIRSQKHCEAIGVSRQTINKIYTSQAYEEAIFNAIYDKGTDDAKAEEQIKKYFYSNYTAFCNVCAYFTNADGSSITTEQKQTLIATFNEIVKQSDNTPEGFRNTCENNGYTSSDVVILKKDSDGYPAGFFLKVYVMDENDVKVFDYDDCVFAIRKENLKNLGESVYTEYRNTCIEDMYAADWQKRIDNFTQNFTVDETLI